MNFTRQDIQKLSEGLAKYAKKDSDFTPLSSINAETGIAVLHEGTNRRVSVNTLSTYMFNNIDISKIPVKFDDVSEKNLYDLLKKVLTSGGYEGTDISLDRVGYNTPQGTIDLGVKAWTAMDHLFKIVYGLLPFPTAADEDEINELFTTTD